MTATSPAPRTRGVNLLFVMADQLTPFALGCYGNGAAKTPNIDRLAERGVRFASAYCDSPLCAPARFALMAGQHITRIGAWDNAVELPASVPTFAHYLRSMGYFTSLAGKMHFVGPDQLHGFEERLTTDVYPADFAWTPDWTRPLERIESFYHNLQNVMTAGVAAATHQFDYDDEVGFWAERRIYELAREPENTPFCLLASFIHPHDPYATRRRYWDRIDHDAVELPRVPAMPRDALDPHSRRIFDGIAADEYDVTDENVLNARHAYLANVAYIDDQVGRLLDALDETGFADNTVVVFTADHGDSLGNRGLWYKMSFLEWSARVPLIVAGPGIAGGRTATGNVGHVDLLPTLTGIASATGAGAVPEPADPLDGRSLVPLLEGDAPDDADEAVGEYCGECAVAPVFMIRRGKWKSVHCAADPQQLFDLEADPDELTNLAGDPAHAETAQAFAAEAAERWDADAITAEVIRSQRRRFAIHHAMERGKRTSWDFQPYRDAGETFMRSHMEVSETDTRFRYPPAEPPAPVKPRAT